jgi:hypothetical protein
MYYYLTLLLGLLLLLSCAQVPSNSSRGYSRRSSERYYQTNGASLYFLNDLPGWANYSTSGACQREENFRWLNFQQVRDSFSLNYAQVVQLQHKYNITYSSKTRLAEKEQMPLAEQERLFHQVVKEIQGGAEEFRIPKYHRIHIVWIDHFLVSNEGKKELSELVQSDSFGQGYPIFLSLCHSSYEIDQLKQELLLFDYAIRHIPVSMFSIYGDKNQQYPYIMLDLANFFPKEKELHLFIKADSLPVEIKGDFKLHQIK